MVHLRLETDSVGNTLEIIPILEIYEAATEITGEFLKRVYSVKSTHKLSKISTQLSSPDAASSPQVDQRQTGRHLENALLYTKILSVLAPKVSIETIKDIINQIFHENHHLNIGNEPALFPANDYVKEHVEQLKGINALFPYANYSEQYGILTEQLNTELKTGQLEISYSLRNFVALLKNTMALHIGEYTASYTNMFIVNFIEFLMDINIIHTIAHQDKIDIIFNTQFIRLLGNFSLKTESII